MHTSQLKRFLAVGSMSVALAAVALISGCAADSSGDSSGPLGRGYVLGEINGEMADEVRDLLRPRPWTGQTDGTLVLQASSVQTLTDAQMANLRSLADNGGAVVLLEARNEE